MRSVASQVRERVFRPSGAAPAVAGVPLHAHAVVDQNGLVAEAVDGAGRRLLADNPALADFARALLATDRDAVRFLHLGTSGDWLAVSVRADRDHAGHPRCDVDVEGVELPFALTPRELDVLTLLAAGLTNDDIAGRLRASSRTVAKHVENLLEKMQLHSRSAAAGLAVDKGWLRLPAPGGVALGALAIGDVERALTTPPQRSRRAPTTKRAIIIGAPRMTGLGREDAEEMYRGTSLAVSEINAAGGVAGRRLELATAECDVTDPQSISRAYRSFLDAEVDAVSVGYSGAEAEMQDAFADYGCPYLHASTSETLVRRVRNEPSRYSNIFQVCPSDIHYGPNLSNFLDGIEQSGEWKPHNKRALAITTGWMEMNLGVPELDFMLARKGWRLDAMHGIAPGNTDWSEVLDRVHRLDPAVIFLGFAFPTASISFQRQFAQAPTRSLIYAMYSPSIPIYRQELGPLADGVLWATTTGLYSDEIAARFAGRYQSTYGVPPGRSHAGIAYDRVRLLANAWSRVGNPRAFARVATDLRNSVHRGVNGSYYLGNAGQSTLAYGNQTQDMSISQAHLIFQIQGSAQRILSPSPYADGHFQLPWWFQQRQ